MTRYSIEPRTRKCVKRYRLLPFARKYKKQLMDTGLGTVKTASKRVVHKRREFLGSKIADSVTKSNDKRTVKSDGNSRNVK